MYTFKTDYVCVNRLRLILFAVLVIILIGIYLLFVWLHKTYPEYFRIDITTVPELITEIFIFFLLSAYVIFAGIILPKWFKAARFTVNGDSVITDTGLIYHSVRTMKLTAVQYTTAVFLPGFCFLIISGTGGRMMIPFLSKKDLRVISEVIEALII
ncbi:MAG: hypothetical protein LBM87_02985 [Ruminococcus sp.]|jgi:hypothetical protein|nr:hypothetical protein [Ruminococcus sp.]